MIISAVLPNPSAGSEWVMLENIDQRLGQKPFKMFLPAIQHYASNTPIEWVGPPPMPAHIDITGWLLGSAGAWFVFPNALPPVPLGAKVIVYFDGLGETANDYDYSDGIAILHTPAGMTGVLPDAAGKVMLYAGSVSTSDNLRAQYEWGIAISDFGFAIAE